MIFLISSGLYTWSHLGDRFIPSRPALHNTDLDPKWLVFIFSNTGACRTLRTSAFEKNVIKEWRSKYAGPMLNILLRKLNSARETSNDPLESEMLFHMRVRFHSIDVVLLTVLLIRAYAHRAAVSVVLHQFTLAYYFMFSSFRASI